VLIHGAWHGAWCWRRLTPLLERAGARVIAPDLPSMAGESTSAERVTLASWARFAADIVESQADPVVLVGHSRGGIVVSEAAELVPGRIRHLVYLSAYLLPAGASLAEEARRDAGSIIAANMIPSATGITCTVRETAVREAFYGQCSEEEYQFAAARLSPEPLKPLVTPLTITDDRFGSVPRAYVETTRDRTVTLESQRRMQAALPCAPVFTLDSDHSPFLSQPEALARILISI
jgi:pimeloyl-ACP methyl ester carboxylesterase